MYILSNAGETGRSDSVQSESTTEGYEGSQMKAFLPSKVMILLTHISACFDLRVLNFV